MKNSSHNCWKLCGVPVALQNRNTLCERSTVEQLKAQAYSSVCVQCSWAIFTNDQGWLNRRFEVSENWEGYFIRLCHFNGAVLIRSVAATSVPHCCENVVSLNMTLAVPEDGFSRVSGQVALALHGRRSRVLNDCRDVSGSQEGKRGLPAL